MQEIIKKLLPIELAFGYLSAKELIYCRGICRDWHLLTMNELDRRRVWNTSLHPKYICPSKINRLEVETCYDGPGMYKYLAKENICFKNVSTLCINSLLVDMERIINELIISKKINAKVIKIYVTNFLSPLQLIKVFIKSCKNLEELTLTYSIKNRLPKDYFGWIDAAILRLHAKKLRTITIDSILHSKLGKESYKLSREHYFELVKRCRSFRAQTININVNFCLNVRQLIFITTQVFIWPKTCTLRIRGKLFVKQGTRDKQTLNRMIMYQKLKSIVKDRELEVIFIERTNLKRILLIKNKQLAFKIP